MISMRKMPFSHIDVTQLITIKVNLLTEKKDVIFLLR